MLFRTGGVILVPTGMGPEFPDPSVEIQISATAATKLYLAGVLTSEIRPFRRVGSHCQKRFFYFFSTGGIPTRLKACYT